MKNYLLRRMIAHMGYNFAVSSSDKAPRTDSADMRIRLSREGVTVAAES